MSTREVLFVNAYAWGGHDLRTLFSVRHSSVFTIILTDSANYLVGWRYGGHIIIGLRRFDCAFQCHAKNLRVHVDWNNQSILTMSTSLFVRSGVVQGVTRVAEDFSEPPRSSF